MKLLIVQFFLVPWYLLPLSSKIFLSTLRSNTFSLWPSCNVTGQVAHRHTATAEIMVLCTLIFILLYSRLEDKSFYAKWSQACPKFSLLLTSSRMAFSFVKCLPKIFQLCYRVKGATINFISYIPHDVWRPRQHARTRTHTHKRLHSESRVAVTSQCHHKGNKFW